MTIRCIELMSKKEFAAALFDPEYETYVVHIGLVNFVASPNFFSLDTDIHFSRRSQISGLIAKRLLQKFLPNT